MAEWGEKNKKPVSLYLRLDSGSQFGMDEKKIRSIIRTRDAWPYVKIRGIHYFSGTLKKAWKMEKELKFLDGFLHEMEEDLGFHTKELEYLERQSNAGNGTSLRSFLRNLPYPCRRC